MTRHAAKVDLNHGEVRDHLRRWLPRFDKDCYVHDCSKVGGGFPDLMVVFKQDIYFVEVKGLTGKRNPKPEALTEAQVEFMRKVPVFVVTSGTEAVEKILAKAGVE